MLACCEDFVMIFSLLVINLLLHFLLIFDIDLLSSSLGRSSIFESPDREDLLLLEESAEMGLWYKLTV